MLETSHINSHIKRLLNLKYKNNININTFYDFLLDVIKFFSDYSSYCTICGNKITFPLNYISTCAKQSCLYDEECMLTNNIITNLYKKDNNVLKLLLDTTFKTLSSPKKQLIFIPFPKLFYSDKKNYSRTKPQSKHMNFNEINKIIINNDKLFNIIKNCNDDIELCKSIDVKLYGFIKFIISSTKNNIISLEMAFDKEIMKNVTIYEIKYNHSLENSFNNNNSQLLFHGSALANWHPIIRTGLKNMSGTNLMANGKAYGNGIYLSHTPNMALGYSRDSTILGICRVKNTKNYKKTNTIYVVPNEKDVLLKYLIKTKTKLSSQDIVKVNTYFTNTLINSINLGSIELINIAKKRLIREFSKIKNTNGLQLLHKSYEKCIVGIKTRMFSQNSSIYKKLNSLNLKGIFVLFQYVDYPSLPPIMSIIMPNIKCTLIKTNGIVIIPQIHYKNWNITNNTSNIIFELIKLLEKTQIAIKSKDKLIINRIEQIDNYNKLIL